MNDRALAAVVLAAGLGTRMKSDLPKVLHPVCGQPMLNHVLDALEGVGSRRVYVVIGHGAELVRERLGGRGECVVQSARLGTAHAAMQARAALEGFEGDVLIVCGDTPLLRMETLQDLVRRDRAPRSSGAVLAARLDDPFGYGRIIRSSDGRAARIVEQKDASEEEAKIQEVNTGVYCVDCGSLFSALIRVGNANAQKEYYLTDIVANLAGDGKPLEVVLCEDPDEMIGVNSRMDLARADRLMRLRILNGFMAAGVTVVDPESTFIDSRATFGRDSTVHPRSAIHGASTIGDGAEIGPGADVRDSRIGPRARIAQSWVEGADIGEGAVVGPYARVCPGAVVPAGAAVESFREFRG